jgi:hypothetical protein
MRTPIDVHRVDGDVLKAPADVSRRPTRSPPLEVGFAKGKGRPAILLVRAVKELRGGPPLEALLAAELERFDP